MTRSARLPSGRLARVGLPALFDILIALVYALFLWAPWDRVQSGAQSTPFTLAWLALPVGLAHHGLSLAYATMTVTICALAAAALAALLSIAARMRASAVLWAAGGWLFGCSVAILMPLWTAVAFLGALLLLLALRTRFVPMQRASTLTAFLNELWPLGYAAGFAALAWRYNPQLLLKTLVIAFGISLVARALVPPAPQIDQSA
jgi:hypothetical protein